MTSDSASLPDQLPPDAFDLSKKQQIGISFAVMVIWPLVGLAATTVEFEPILIFAFTIGFYLWLFAKGLGGAAEPVLEWLFSAPDPWGDIVIWGIIALLAGFWVVVLLLPLFGDWRTRLPWLWVIQTVYAAIQAITPLIVFE